MRRKEYAVSLGLATAGRGRMSREALDAIDKARGEGMKFDDDVPTSSTPRVSAKAPKPVKDKAVSRDVPTGMIGDAVYHHPLGTEFVGTDSKGKRHTVSGRGVCRKSGYSMVGCACGSHETLAPNLEVITVTVK